MTIEPLPNAIKNLVQDAIQTLHPRRVILFGSRAVGDAEPRSDFDIAVDAPDLDAGAWTRFVLDVQETLPTLAKVDLIRYDSASPELRTNIDKDGISLYERPE
jgi:predicted nucleotidyltransferase